MVSTDWPAEELGFDLKLAGELNDLGQRSEPMKFLFSKTHIEGAKTQGGSMIFCPFNMDLRPEGERLMVHISQGYQ